MSLIQDLSHTNAAEPADENADPAPDKDADVVAYGHPCTPHGLPDEGSGDSAAPDPFALPDERSYDSSSTIRDRPWIPGWSCSTGTERP